MIVVKALCGGEALCLEWEMEVFHLISSKLYFFFPAWWPFTRAIVTSASAGEIGIDNVKSREFGTHLHPFSTSKNCIVTTTHHKNMSPAYD